MKKITGKKSHFPPFKGSALHNALPLESLPCPTEQVNIPARIRGQLVYKSSLICGSPWRDLYH